MSRYVITGTTVTLIDDRNQPVQTEDLTTGTVTYLKPMQEVEYETWPGWVAGWVAIIASAVAVGYGLAWVMTK